jgi:hypothetical protein
VNCFNLSPEGATNVKSIAEWILDAMKKINIPIEFALAYSISVFAISISLNSLGFIPYLTMMKRALN